MNVSSATDVIKAALDKQKNAKANTGQTMKPESKPQPHGKPKEPPMSVWLPMDLRKQAKAYGHATDTSVSGIITSALREYLVGHLDDLTDDQKSIYDSYMRIQSK